MVNLKYRGKYISKHLYKNGAKVFFQKDGVTVIKKYFPNGTGGEDTPEFLKMILRNIPSDKYQLEGSDPHDLMYFIGGSEKDRKYADKYMLKKAIKAVKRSISAWRPSRYFFISCMYRNYFVVRNWGKDSFDYNNFDFKVKNLKRTDFDTEEESQQYIENCINDLVECM